jgi:hypothetical protein
MALRIVDSRFGRSIAIWSRSSCRGFQSDKGIHSGSLGLLVLSNRLAMNNPVKPPMATVAELLLAGSNGNAPSEYRPSSPSPSHHTHSIYFVCVLQKPYPAYRTDEGKPNGHAPFCKAGLFRLNARWAVQVLANGRGSGKGERLRRDGLEEVGKVGREITDQ